VNKNKTRKEICPLQLTRTRELIPQNGNLIRCSKLHDFFRN